jgi:acyl carrier protein
MVKRIESLGAAVHIACCDVASPPRLREFAAEFARAGYPPIRGIAHTATSTRDELLTRIQPESLHSVFWPKLNGALALADVFAADDLDFFLLYSSAAGLLGQPGQGSYAAANAGVDALAEALAARGYPAKALDWGPWEGRGLAETEGGRGIVRQLAAEGIAAIPVDEGARAIWLALDASAPVQSVILRAAWDQRPASLSARNSLLADLVAAESASGAAKSELRTRLERAAGASDRAAILEAYLASAMGSVLRMGESTLGLERPFGEFGVDSMIALEFRNRIEREIGLPFSATLLFAHPTIRALAAHIADKIGDSLETRAEPPAQAETEVETQDGESLAQLLERAAQLSEDQLSRLVHERSRVEP